MQLNEPNDLKLSPLCVPHRAAHNRDPAGIAQLGGNRLGQGRAEEAGMDFHVAGEEIGVLAEAVSPFIMPLCRSRSPATGKRRRGQSWYL